MTHYIYLKTTEPNDEPSKLLVTKYGTFLSVGRIETTLHHRGLWTIGYTANIKIVDSFGNNTLSRTEIDPITGDPLTEDWTNTFDKYGVVVTNNDVIDNPAIDTYYVTVPGSSTVIDLSEYIAGKPSYKQRKLTLDFAFEMDPDLCMSFFSDFVHRYHGRRAQFILDNDPEWCYEGRITVGPLKRKISLCQFTLTADCDPYKYKATETSTPWHYTIDKTKTRL